MRDSFVYRLHSERRIGGYLKLVDPALFGRGFSHLCSLRAVATMVARRIHDRAVEPDDIEEIARINREVAGISGHAPRSTLR